MNNFADRQVFQELKVRIPVAGDDAVARLSGERADAEVPGTERERSTGPSL